MQRAANAARFWDSFAQKLSQIPPDSTWTPTQTRTARPDTCNYPLHPSLLTILQGTALWAQAGKAQPYTFLNMRSKKDPSHVCVAKMLMLQGDFSRIASVPVGW